MVICTAGIFLGPLLENGRFGCVTLVSCVTQMEEWVSDLGEGCWRQSQESVSQNESHRARTCYSACVANLTSDECFATRPLDRQPYPAIRSSIAIGCYCSSQMRLRELFTSYT